ncbi:hypothetical protein E4U55_006648 [Claviceps digitariae]|nr:hypothetical protein E4U55_006648 [Claviceps digitariae]
MIDFTPSTPVTRGLDHLSDASLGIVLCGEQTRFAVRVLYCLVERRTLYELRPETLASAAADSLVAGEQGTFDEENEKVQYNTLPYKNKTQTTCVCMFCLLCLPGSQQALSLTTTTTTTTTTTSSPRVVVERLIDVPRGWTVLGPAPGDHTIRLSIALESSAGHDQLQRQLERELHQISDPDHRRYGQHLSRDEARALLRPRPEAVESVQRWLSSAAVPEDQVRHRGHVLEATVRVRDAEALLETKYSIFARHGGGRAIVGTLAYSVPAHLRLHIAAIQPTTFFDTASHRPGLDVRHDMQYADLQPQTQTAKQQQQKDKDTCATSNTPACLRRLYGMKSHVARPDPRSLLGVVGFNKYSQLSKYIDTYAPYAKGAANFTVALINNATNPQGPNYPSGEANLDMQIAVAMAYQVPVRFYSTGGEDHDFDPDLDISDRQNEYIEPWLQFVSYMLDLPDQELPQVMSISYGVNEQAVPKPYAQRICHMFGQLALRGMSVIVASGDTGPGVSCQSNAGHGTTNATRFLPTFPATCPFVTSVGATEGISPERALNFSSGGFSDYWSRPAWQEEAVTTYLSRHGERWTKYYNRGGRGFPDVAAQGIGYPIFNHDKLENGGGTSASAPLFASMIALINDDRLKRKKPALGFLNPWLYKVSRSAFTDITVGRSEGCKGYSFSGAQAPLVPQAGWDAVEGWDPVTGLGTPRFERLHELAMLKCK